MNRQFSKKKGGKEKPIRNTAELRSSNIVIGINKPEFKSQM